MPDFDFADRVQFHTPDAPPASVPATAGIYLLFDENRRVRRMGSTRDLRARARYYLHPREDETLRSVARRESTTLGWLPTFSRFESRYAHLRLYRAFFPEAMQPLYRLSSAQLLRVTMGEAYPRLFPVRDLREPEHRHVGPYLHRDMAEAEAKVVTDLLELRRCDYLIVPHQPYERCLYLQMRTCVAPCDDFEQPAYYALSEQAMALLSGEVDAVNRTLIARRDRAAAELAFEEATRWRDAIRGLERWAEQRPPFIRPIERLDLVVPQRTELGIDLFVVRGGRLVGWERLEEPDEEALVLLLARLREQPVAHPAWPEARDDLAFIARWLWDRDHAPYAMLDDPEAAATRVLALTRTDPPEIEENEVVDDD